MSQNLRYDHVFLSLSFLTKKKIFIVFN